MSRDFDRLADRVTEVADMLYAFGLLNNSGDGLEIRFQMKPPSTLWRDRRLGYSQRFSSAAELEAFLAAVEQAAAARSAQLDAGDSKALDAVLERGMQSRRNR